MKTIKLTDEELAWLLKALENSNAREREVAIDLGVRPSLVYEYLSALIRQQLETQNEPHQSPAPAPETPAAP